MDRFRIGILIPAYNEQNTIKKIAQNCSKFGKVIIVNDASTDNTLVELSNLNCHIINNDKNLGYEKSLSVGFKFANENNLNYVITIDADGQHDVELIKIIIESFKKGYDCVVFKRDFIPRLSEKLFCYFGSNIYKISDPCCGLKGYNIEIYKKQGYFSNFNSIGTQLVFFAKKNNFKIKEFGMKLNLRNDNSRFGNTITSNLWITIALIYSFIKYFYDKKV